MSQHIDPTPKQTSLDSLSDSMFHFRGTLSGADINNIKSESAQGVYALGGNNTNIPSPANWGTLIVIYSSGGTHQLSFNANGIWIRSYTGSPLSWTAWKSATLTLVS